MIHLTKNEAIVYECLKSGIKNLDGIGKATLIGIYRAKLAMITLVEKGAAVKNVKKKGYTALDIQYCTKEEDPRPTVPITYNDQATQEQKDYIINHWKYTDRTYLAKDLGIRKLDLNFMVERMRKEGVKLP